MSHASVKIDSGNGLMPLGNVQAIIWSNVDQVQVHTALV